MPASARGSPARSPGSCVAATALGVALALLAATWAVSASRLGSQTASRASPFWAAGADPGPISRPPLPLGTATAAASANAPGTPSASAKPTTSASVPGTPSPPMTPSPVASSSGAAASATAVDRTNYTACGNDIRALATPWAVPGHALGSTPLPCDSLPRLISSMASGRRAAADAPFQAGGCAPVWYPARESCALLHDRDVSIVMIGDSLTRHVAQAVFTILSGDFALGGSAWWRMTALERAECACAEAYREKSCRHLSAARWYAESSQRVCGGDVNESTAEPPRVTYLEWFDVWYEAELRRTLAAQVAAGRFVVAYFTVGLHYSEAPERGVGRTGALAGMLRVAAEFAPNVSTLVATGHSTGSGPQQTAAHMHAMNDQLRERAAEARMPRLAADGAVAVGPTPVLETVALTRNATAYDGTHHTFLNVPLAMWALNAFDFMSAGRARISTSSRRALDSTSAAA